MPRITDSKRAANRATVVSAARRCFARKGFHQTSMPDIAAEAGMSTGAPYRYIASKQELVVEIARTAFESVFEPALEMAAESGPAVGIGDLVARAAAAHRAPDGGDSAESDELLRCAVDAWGELLRNEDLRAAAMTGVNRTLNAIAEILRRGQEAGSVPSELDAASTARIVLALVHGFMLQRAAFGLTDVDQFVRDVRRVVDSA